MKWKKKFRLHGKSTVFATSPLNHYGRKADARKTASNYKSHAKRLKEQRYTRIVYSREGGISGWRLWKRAEPKGYHKRRS